MDQGLGRAWRARDRDRRLADAERVEHVELPGLEGREATAIDRLKLQPTPAGEKCYKHGLTADCSVDRA